MGINYDVSIAYSLSFKHSINAGISPQFQQMYFLS